MVSEVEVTKALNMELRMADIAARKDRPFWWNFNPALQFGRQVLAEATRRLHMSRAQHFCLLFLSFSIYLQVVVTADQR